MESSRKTHTGNITSRKNSSCPEKQAISRVLYDLKSSEIDKGDEGNEESVLLNDSVMMRNQVTNNNRRFIDIQDLINSDDTDEDPNYELPTMINSNSSSNSKDSTATDKPSTSHQHTQFRAFKLEVGTSLIERNDSKVHPIQPEFEDVEKYENTGNQLFRDRRAYGDPSLDRRIQGSSHIPDCTKGQQKRCAFPKCTKKSTVYCIKCKVYLCLVDGRNCIRNYHEKQ